MRSDVFLDLLAEISELDADEGIKSQIRKCIHKVGAMHKVPALGRLERVEFAVGLLNQAVSVPTIRERLMARFPIAERQAYRDITKALNLRQKPPLNGTRP